MLKKLSNFVIIWSLVNYFSSVICFNSSNGINHIPTLKYPTVDLKNYPHSRGHDWYLDGYGSEVYGKTDYYWLIPLVIVIGFGALLLPLLGTLMTTVLTSGTLTLTAGRRKRSTDYKEKVENSIESKGFSQSLIGVLAQLESAIDKFGKDFNKKF